ncbi:MAG: ADP-ribosylation factor-like protein [Promethearchaeota archaeon]
MKPQGIDSSMDPITKILLIGLDNGGKSSISKCLRGIKGLSAFNSPMPTKGANVLEFEALNSKYSIWDLGGQKAYRDEYLNEFETYLKQVHKIIYVIDIQDVNRYKDALEYLKKVINAITSQKEIEFSVFLHKFDPDLKFDSKLNEKVINRFIKEIKEIFPSDFIYSINKTSIYATFEKSIII